jgi:PadR family transcriptional regulator PadR
MKPGPIQTDLLQGTLDLLILKTLQPGARHGWDIAQRIEQVSGEVLRVGQGSLYPALHRLEDRGWIAAEWGASENNRRARFYKLTAAGRRQLAEEAAGWARFVAAVAQVLGTP